MIQAFTGNVQNQFPKELPKELPRRNWCRSFQKIVEAIHKVTTKPNGFPNKIVEGDQKEIPKKNPQKFELKKSDCRYVFCYKSLRRS